MKKLLLVSVFAALPFSGHAADLYSDNAQYNFIQDNAPAQPAAVGHLSLGGGYVDTESSGPGGREYGIFSGAGRANVHFGWLNLELETGGSAGFNEGNSYSSIGVAGHLWGSTGNLALGVFGGVNFPTGYSIYTAGGEMEIYLGALTLGADGSYHWIDNGAPLTGDDFWTARAWADFYLTSNSRIGAEFSYGSGDNYFGPTRDADFWAVTLDAEHRFAGTPISLWIEGRYAEFDLPPLSNDFQQWSGLAGFRIFLDGGMTLHEHDKMVPWDGGLSDFRSLSKPAI